MSGLGGLSVSTIALFGNPLYFILSKVSENHLIFLETTHLFKDGILNTFSKGFFTRIKNKCYSFSRIF